MQAVLPFPDITPEIFAIELGGITLALRWYALAYISGFLIGWGVLVALMRRPAVWPGGQAPMAPGAVEGLLTWVIVGVILGGRLGFVLFYQPGHYLRHPWEALAIWQGGMAFHGGLLGAAVAAALFARRHGVPALRLGDAMALAAPVGIALGRVANFINAELWGRPTDVPWGVVFPGPAAQDCPPAMIGPMGCARHPTQLYEAGLEGVVLGLVLLGLVVWGRALLRPGLVTGVFLAGYGLARLVVEIWREADAQFVTFDNPAGHVLRLGDAGLQMGQVLSLPMIALGAALVVRALWTR
ncbi:prolipoprotein diacylglyceryl transferase [Rhodobaculum claviforme]|uniref:Phosphatidylglycerol--prolipoprotein diacylglyceryl transferase n=1 Tax=Rhodobaculum claviforme TaxID=1549854 RepID=A0A934WID1_9RHOB|nr:prolipoprotein diacylglyceryl transferase [Rhodobaculum claviforme]MBK5928080.1 prolipoprotein diacylglyceryl transferase [Rhodobaculum claviforme]